MLEGKEVGIGHCHHSLMDVEGEQDYDRSITLRKVKNYRRFDRAVSMSKSH